MVDRDCFKNGWSTALSCILNYPHSCCTMDFILYDYKFKCAFIRMAYFVCIIQVSFAQLIFRAFSQFLCWLLWRSKPSSLPLTCRKTGCLLYSWSCQGKSWLISCNVSELGTEIKLEASRQQQHSSFQFQCGATVWSS